MFKEKWGNKRSIFTLTGCILMMLLVFCVVFNYTFAWLSGTIEKPSVGTTNLGQIAATTSTTDNTFTATMPNVGSYINLSTQSKVTNSGSLNALVRVFYAIVIDEAAKQIATTTDFSSVGINADFIESDENIDNVYSGYYYYNKVLAPNESVSLFTTLSPTSTVASKDVKVKLYYELVNYDGGPYILQQELPWSNTPPAWFLNYDSVTKSASSLVSPKLNIKFAQVSKVEITAKTSSTSKNLLLGRYGGAYIGANGSSWVFNNLSNGTYSKSPSDFCNGQYNTIVFTWTGATVATDDYISLVTDATWSKEISYKQIKIWNTAGELVYDLRPNITGTTPIPAGDGKFINKVDGTILPMYTFSSGAATETSNAYKYVGKVVYYNDFEGSAVGDTLTTSNGATSSVVTGNAKNGTKSIKLTTSLNYASVTASEPAKLGWITSGATSNGHRYNISMWVKTDAPKGTMAYYKNGSNTLAMIPCIVVNGLNCKVNLDKYGEWTLLSVTTPVISASDPIKFGFVIPTGSTYVTYIDDIVISIAD